MGEELGMHDGAVRFRRLRFFRSRKDPDHHLNANDLLFSCLEFEMSKNENPSLFELWVLARKWSPASAPLAKIRTINHSHKIIIIIYCLILSVDTMFPVIRRSLNRSCLLPTMVARAGVIVRTNMYSPISSFRQVDPEKIFDEIDSLDGVIDKAEFLWALDQLCYNDLVKVHKAAEAYLAYLENKLQTVQKMEGDIVELEAAYAEKQDAYNNIRLMTAADIDALFDKSQMKKKDLKDSLGELKSLIAEAHSTLHIEREN
jgi:hypothetical protein